GGRAVAAPDPAARERREEHRALAHPDEPVGRRADAVERRIDVRDAVGRERARSRGEGEREEQASQDGSQLHLVLLRGVILAGHAAHGRSAQSSVPVWASYQGKKILWPARTKS